MSNLAPSSTGSLMITMPNGEKVRGFAVTQTGEILFMDSTGTMREMHPLIVESLANQMIPNGIFAVAVMKRTATNNPMIRELGKTSLGLVDK